MDSNAVQTMDSSQSESVLDNNVTPDTTGPDAHTRIRGRGFKGRVRSPRGQMMMMMMKGYGPPGPGRGRGRDGIMNGFGPRWRGMGRMRPYPDLRGARGGRAGPVRMRMAPPPPIHMRGPFPPRRRPAPPLLPPPGHPAFRGRPPHPGLEAQQHFHPRGFYNGPPPPPPPGPSGRGQRWPGPPGNQRF